MDIIGRIYMLITSGNSRVKQATKENFKSHKIKNIKNYTQMWHNSSSTILFQISQTVKFVKTTPK